MTSEEYKQFEKLAFIAASGDVLTTHLPDDYDTWSEEKGDQFVKDNAWQPFEDWEAKDLWKHIASQASSLKSFHISMCKEKRCLKL